MKLRFNCRKDFLRDCFKNGEIILAYYKAERTFHAYQPNHIEKVELKDVYTMEESPRQEFIKYLADLKVTEALAKSNGKQDKAEAITQWFTEFQNLLQRIFDDPFLELIFEEDTFSFSIKEKNIIQFIMSTHSPFILNSLPNAVIYDLEGAGTGYGAR